DRHKRPNSEHTAPGGRGKPRAGVRPVSYIELRDRRLADHLAGHLGLEAPVAIAGHGGLHLLARLDVLFAPLLWHYSMTSRPIDRAVPSIIFIAASGSYAFKSLRFSSTIWRSCCLV